MRVVGQCIRRHLIGLCDMACIGESVDEQPTIRLVARRQRHRPTSRRHRRSVVALRLQLVGSVCRPVRLVPHACLHGLFCRLQQLAILRVVRGERYRFACPPNRFDIITLRIRLIRCVRRIIRSCRWYDRGVFARRLRVGCSAPTDQACHEQCGYENWAYAPAARSTHRCCPSGLSRCKQLLLGRHRLLNRITRYDALCDQKVADAAIMVRLILR